MNKNIIFYSNRIQGESDNSLELIQLYGHYS